MAGGGCQGFWPEQLKQQTWSSLSRTGCRWCRQAEWQCQLDMGQEVRGKTDELRLEMDLLATAEGSHGGVARGLDWAQPAG